MANSTLMINSEITPKTRVGDFLTEHPELEDLLISLSPTFEKLKNPVLRRTIGRVATFQQIAVVGNIPLELIINTLRKAAGQNQTNETMENTKNLNEQPLWFNVELISEVLDAREMLKNGAHPVADVLSKTATMNSGTIFELITPFVPMPLIEKVTDTGLRAFVKTVTDSEFHTYFYKD